MKVKAFLYLALPVVVIGTLYVVLSPQRTADMRAPSPASSAIAMPERATNVSPPPSVPATDLVRNPDAGSNTFEIVVRGGRRTSGPAVIKVRKGDEVTLRVTTDTADELHLHGYGLHAAVSPERAITLQFTAKLTGRFVYELHRSGLELGALEVFPQ